MAMMRESQGHIDVNRLRALGFSEELITEAAESEAAGVLNIIPPPDLFDRTIARCAALFPEPAPTPEKSASWWEDLGNWFANLFVPNSPDPTPLPEPNPRWPGLEPIVLASVAANAPALPESKARWAALETMFEAILASADISRLPALLQTARTLAPSRGALLPLYCASALEFAVQKHERPLLILENHNVIEPRWWETDADFRRIRTTCQWLNQRVASYGIAPSARVVVLRPEVDAYSTEDLEVLRRLLHETMSDIWFLPFSRAGDYARQDITVVGDQEVFRMTHKVESPQEAWSVTEMVENSEQAATLRTNLASLVNSAYLVKRGGRLRDFYLPTELEGPAGMRALLQRAIRNSKVLRLTDLKGSITLQRD